MNRRFTSQEEIKVLMSEVFRTGDLTDEQWTAKYELLKQKSPLEEMGQFMEIMIDKGYSLDESRNVVKEMLLKVKRKSELKDV